MIICHCPEGSAWGGMLKAHHFQTTTTTTTAVGGRVAVWCGVELRRLTHIKWSLSLSQLLLLCLGIR